jgi:hypothetical protein
MSSLVASEPNLHPLFAEILAPFAPGLELTRPDPPLCDVCHNLDVCGEYGCLHDSALEYPGED